MKRCLLVRGIEIGGEADVCKLGAPRARQIGHFLCDHPLQIRRQVGQYRRHAPLRCKVECNPHVGPQGGLGLIRYGRADPFPMGETQGNDIEIRWCIACDNCISITCA